VFATKRARRSRGADVARIAPLEEIMNLIRRNPNTTNNTWDPFREFQELSDRLNRMFEPRYVPAREDTREQALTVFDWAPAVNISETDKAYVVKADLPDVKKEDVKVTHDNGVLTLEGERRHEKREEGEKFHRVESSYGKFLRRFTLPEDAQVESIEAAFKDGALSVVIPKAEVKQPKAREIKVG
jgi:HSP20 family protein